MAQETSVAIVLPTKYSSLQQIVIIAGSIVTQVNQFWVENVEDVTTDAKSTQDLQPLTLPNLLPVNLLDLLLLLHGNLLLFDMTLACKDPKTEDNKTQVLLIMNIALSVMLLQEI